MSISMIALVSIEYTRLTRAGEKDIGSLLVARHVRSSAEGFATRYGGVATRRRVDSVGL